jgi:hypothetical protein
MGEYRAMTEELTNDTFRWLVGGLLGLLTAIGSFFVKSISARLDAVEVDLSRRNERISVLEAHFESVDRRLDRIDQKLDILLEARK